MIIGSLPQAFKGESAVFLCRTSMWQSSSPTRLRVPSTSDNEVAIAGSTLDGTLLALTILGASSQAGVYRLILNQASLCSRCNLKKSRPYSVISLSSFIENSVARLCSLRSWTFCNITFAISDNVLAWLMGTSSYNFYHFNCSFTTLFSMG